MCRVMERGKTPVKKQVLSFRQQEHVRRRDGSGCGGGGFRGGDLEKNRERGGGGVLSQTAVKPEGFLGMVPDTIIPGHTQTHTNQLLQN